MKLPLPSILAVLLLSQLSAAPRVPIDAQQQVKLWTNSPATRPAAIPEVDDGTGRFRNVSDPVMFVWPAPADKANGTAIIACPKPCFCRTRRPQSEYMDENKNWSPASCSNRNFTQARHRPQSASQRIRAHSVGA